MLVRSRALLVLSGLAAAGLAMAPGTVISAGPADNEVLSAAADVAPGSESVRRAEPSLPAGVRKKLERYKLAPDNLSILVQDLDADEPLLAFNAGVPRNPASTMKLLTTYVALDVLGPGHVWKTRVYLDGPLVGDRLEGDLVITGGGDPFLTTENFWKLLRGLRSRGLRHVTGDLVVDNSYFDPGQPDPGEFDGQPFRSYNVAPDALLVNFKTARFSFYPEASGRGVRVVTDPALPNLVIDNRLRLRGGACRGFQRGVSFNVDGGVYGGKVVLEGSFPSGCREYAFSRSVMAPEQFAFGAFKGLWEEMGGRIDGGVRLGRAPDGEQAEAFYEHWSPTLSEVVRSINKFSNNVMTRHLLLTMGARVQGAPGTEEKGRAVVGEWLRARGLDLPGLGLVNGAGLSRDTRISAASMGELLRHGWKSRYMPELVASLPLSGNDGTLRRRFDDDSLAGQFHLKTGSMDHVSAIAGYAISRSGRRYAVVMLHNDIDVHRGYGENVQDALLRWVMEQ